MTSAYARAPRGAPAVDRVLRNYGRNVSLIAALRLTGLAAPLVVEGSVNMAVFEVYTEHILAPTLQPGAVVLMDNLSCHQAQTVRQLIEARGGAGRICPVFTGLLARPVAY